MDKKPNKALNNDAKKRRVLARRCVLKKWNI